MHTEEEYICAGSISTATRRDGVTPAERYLKRLCENSFLTLWSYAGVYRDQGKNGSSGDGKEVCDLLVVFEDHIIIFSDKDCEFPRTRDLDLDWSRWFRRAVQESAKQLWGAERWIRTYPERLFLDSACTKPFPLELPDFSSAKFHRILVAHQASARCREELGGSGSLMIQSDRIGGMHCLPTAEGGLPFAIGQIDPSKGFVHVLDDTSLEVVMRTLDTIGDFVAYLTKKEKFLSSGRSIMAAGEEELLAFYLKGIGDDGEHDFVVSDEYNAIYLDEGFWDGFVNSPQRKAQLQANEISYAWDALIETFSEHLFAGTQYYVTHPGIADQEKMFRFLARERRTRRRMLAEGLLEVIRTTPRTMRRTRVIYPSQPGDPHYVFLVLPHPSFAPYESYREVRLQFLQACCMVTKLKCAEAQHIIGIATEPSRGETGSEDLLYYDASSWSAEEEEEAKRLQQDLSLLENPTFFQTTIQEYPEVGDAASGPNTSTP